jgi:hypothetical protein
MYGRMLTAADLMRDVEAAPEGYLDTPGPMSFEEQAELRAAGYDSGASETVYQRGIRIYSPRAIAAGLYRPVICKPADIHRRPVPIRYHWGAPVYR